MSITEKLNKIKSCKEDIKQAIIDKCVDMTDVSLEGYATKISEIQTGGGSGDYLDIRANLSTYYSTAEYIPSFAFTYCTSLQSVNLPNCVSAGDNAFQSCSSLQTANLPNCSSIGSNAFQSCSSLQSIDLPMCSYVGGSAFQSCSSLTSVNLPMCSYVDMYAFLRCSSLQSINLPMCASVANYAFESCSSLTSVNLPMCIHIGGSAFQYCKSLSVLDIRSTYSCSLLNSRAFSSTPFASGVGSIYVHAAHLSQFQNATNWTYFSNCLVGVGDPTRPLLSFDNGRVYGDTYYLYSNWKPYMNITSNSVIYIDLPNCSYVGNNAFQSCTSLTSIDLPNCRSIGSKAFQYCSSLQSIDLPMCSSIGSFAFQKCTSLQTIYLPKCSFIAYDGIAVVENIKAINIGTDISTVCKLTNNNGFLVYRPSIFVPMSLVDAYKSAQYWSDYASLIYGI